MLKRLRGRRAYARSIEALTAALEARVFPEAEEEARRAVVLAERWMPPSAAIGPRYALAAALLAQGRCAEAEAPCREAIALARRDPRASDPPLPQLYDQLAAILDGRGDHEALEALLRELVAGYDRMRAPDPDDHATTLERLALLLARADRREEAEPLFRRAVAIHEANLPTLGEERLAERLYNAATFHPELPLAVPLFERARGLATAADLAARIAHNLAAAYEAAGRDDDARAAYRAALDHRETRPTLVRLARLEHAASRFDEAASLYERALVLARAERPADEAIVGRITLWLGDARSEIFR